MNSGRTLFREEREIRQELNAGSPGPQTLFGNPRPFRSVAMLAEFPANRCRQISNGSPRPLGHFISSLLAGLLLTQDILDGYLREGAERQDTFSAHRRLASQYLPEQQGHVLVKCVVLPSVPPEENRE